MLLSLRILLGLSALLTMAMAAALLFNKHRTEEEERVLCRRAIIGACVTLVLSVTVLLLR